MKISLILLNSRCKHQIKVIRGRKKTFMLKSGDIVITEFPGVVAIKKRPAVILSSEKYHKETS